MIIFTSGSFENFKKETLLFDSENAKSDYQSPAASSSDLPTFYNTTTPIPAESPMETSLQIMKRLRSSSPESHFYGGRSYSIDSSPNQSPNRPDSPEHMGVLSPASSPPHRVFKRRRRESRSPIRSSPDPSGDESSFGGQVLGDDGELSPGNVDDSVFKPLLNSIPKKVTPRTTTPEESSLVMIQRFMTSQTLEIHRLAMKQLCTVKAITVQGLEFIDFRRIIDFYQ